MSELKVIDSLAEPAPRAEPFAGAVVQLEANEETATILLQAAVRSGAAQRVLVTYKGRALGEVVPVRDAALLEKLKGRAIGATGPPAGAVMPAAPDPDWQERWEALQARVQAAMPAGVTEEEIDEGIERAIQEARSERIARRS